MEFETRLADRGRWRADACSAAMVLDLLGTKTVFLVVRECFYGTTRFEDFVERIGVSAPAVSRALRQLESADVIARTPYREAGARTRDEYRLTAAGEDLLPVLLALVQWGDTHLQDGRPPLRFVARDSGDEIRVCVTADHAREVDSDDIAIRAAR
ncbi:helix-turn-helix domain-containing protein [Williamsia sp.]|uniref:winged helix-turn-helix transcriptional regulator n=1 Tax=Williamsia sp. TaxID=1872085 RepID=UPI001A1D0E70|nr:helix-turn-helix domain-containing protein [Williamsia sp.]MBJ7289973.1 helix-turn-helix transcriptional regulator [Williamsia sp.]